MRDVGAVIIGRNEGERLRACLQSLAHKRAACVYVDSGSEDDSVAIAESMGVEVVKLDMTRPFTAARARNCGFRALLGFRPDLKYVQFVDGDCQLDGKWLENACAYLEAHPDVAVVAGRRRERHPDASIYNRLCDMEWDTPIGEANACGGDAMMRVTAFQNVEGFRESLIAGEEPELCQRLRNQGHRIERLPFEMTSHDAAMTRFSQWWKRSVRAGHAFAEVSNLHRNDAYPIWRHECRSIAVWGIVIPLLAIALALGVHAAGALLLLAYLALVVKVASAAGSRFGTWNAYCYAVFCVLAKFPQAQGMLCYYWNRARHQSSKLIEYKSATTSNRKCIAYLINQYPQLSHSFIRREIRGLEQQGLRIERISLRPHQDCTDPADALEAERTWILQRAGAFYIAKAIASALLRPIAFTRALVMTFRMSRRSPKGLLKHLAYFAEACVLRRRLNECGVQHVHSHFGTNTTAIALLTHLLGGPPYSFTVHGPEEFDAPEALALGEKIRYADFVVAISEFGRSQLYRWCPVTQWSKIHVVHCGVDREFLETPMAPVVSEPRLISVGRLCEQKGQLLLLQAAARLRECGRAFNIRIVGEGPMRRDLEAMIRAYKLENYVHLLGAQPQSRVREEILAARAMVLPSFAEGLPVVLMESLALGRPVVSTWIAGIPELVVPRQNGWLVPAGDVDALVAALIQVLDGSGEWLEAMGEHGRKAVRRNHDILHETWRLANLFRFPNDRESNAARSSEDCAPPARTACAMGRN